MDKDAVIEYLSDNDLGEIEEIEYKSDVAVFRFYYDFDDDQLKSARAYANDEYDGETESEAWYNEFFLPYLYEMALDDVGEVLEEIMENFQLKVQYIGYENDSENYDYCEFIAAMSEKENNFRIEEILEQLEL